MSLRRRRLLALSGVALAGFAGCVGDDESNDGAETPETDSDGTPTETDPDDRANENEQTEPQDGKQDNPVWTYDTGGSLATVEDGVLYGRESFDEGSGGVLALDVLTGDRLWRYGETGGYSTFTEPVADGDIYVGFGDDAIGSGAGQVHALDSEDGTERWVTETGSVYHPPRLTDETLVAGSDDGKVYCLDRDTGEPVWAVGVRATESSGPQGPSVAAVTDGVAVVELEERVLGLDAADGTERWAFEPGDGRITSVVVEDQVYSTTHERVYALAGGDSQWSYDHQGGRIEAVADGCVYLADSSRVAAVDAAQGIERWFVRTDDYPALETTDGAVYFGTTGVRKLTPAGETLWETDLDGSELQTIAPARDGVYAGTESAVYRLDSGSEVVADGDATGIDLVVGDWVYAGGRDQITALRL